MASANDTHPWPNSSILNNYFLIHSQDNWLMRITHIHGQIHYQHRILFSGGNAAELPFGLHVHRTIVVCASTSWISNSCTGQLANANPIKILSNSLLIHVQVQLANANDAYPWPIPSNKFIYNY